MLEILENNKETIKYLIDDEDIWYVSGKVKRKYINGLVRINPVLLPSINMKFEKLHIDCIYKLSSTDINQYKKLYDVNSTLSEKITHEREMMFFYTKNIKWYKGTNKIYCMDFLARTYTLDVSSPIVRLLYNRHSTKGTKEMILLTGERKIQELVDLITFHNPKLNIKY